MNGRISDRKKRRMPCKLRVASREHNGLVLDLSPSGLYVQTNAKPGPGTAVEITLADPGREPMHLEAEVARRKAVPAALLSVTKGGLGVRIVSAPEAYYRFLGELGIPIDGAGHDGLRFRLRVCHGSRSKRVEIEAADPDDATRLVLAKLGEGWKVLGVETLGGPA